MKLKDYIEAFGSSYSKFYKERIRPFGNHPNEPIFLIIALMMEINIKLYRIETQDKVLLSDDIIPFSFQG